MWKSAVIKHTKKPMPASLTPCMSHSESYKTPSWFGRVSYLVFSFSKNIIPQQAPNSQLAVFDKEH
jgi:hypothetical protein